MLGRNRKGGCLYPQQQGSVLPVPLEKQGERAWACAEFLTCSLDKPTRYWRPMRPGTGAVLWMSAGIFEPTVSLYKGCVVQSTTAALMCVASRLWVIPVSFPVERGNHHCFGTVLQLRCWHLTVQVSCRRAYIKCFFPSYPLFPLPSPSHPHMFQSHSPRQGHFGPQG